MTTTTHGASLDRGELLLKAGMMSQRMAVAVNAERKPLVRDQRRKLRFFKNAFLGSEAVGWAVETGFAPSRVAATKLFDDFLTVGALLALSRKGHVFSDEFLYSWPVGPPGAPSQPDRRGSAKGSVSEEDGEAAIGDMAKLIHLHTAISEKNKLRHDEWRKSQLPVIRKKIEELELELGNWRRKLEGAVEKTKKTKNPDVASLILIDELESAVTTVSTELDNNKQLMHFPGPEGWIYRFGSDGAYIGIKHPYLEMVKARWSLRAGSTLMANPSIKAGVSGHHFEMKFSPVVISVAFDGVSIVGEKGSGVPSFQTDRLALDLELCVEAQLRFNVATSTWKASYFEFNLVDVGKTEVLGLPPALLQWIINKFAPARVKKAILSSLPVALGKYLAGGGEVLEMSGDLSVRGIPFAVLESPLSLPRQAMVPDELPEAHWSALKLLNTGIDCITHGHVLSELRKRLSLAGLSRVPLFKRCSKWSTVSRLLAYVRTLDREATSMEHDEIMRAWQHALNTVTGETGISPIDLKVLFNRLRLLDRVPFEVSYVISEFNGSMDVGRLTDCLRDTAHEFLNTAKTDLTDVKVLNEMRQGRSFEDLNAWHRETKAALTKVTEAIQKVSVGLSGRLLGGKEGIFDVGTDAILVRLKPGVQFPLDEILLAPSDISMSFFAVEDEGGKFIVDVGVPKSEKITEDGDETKHDSLLSLCTGAFWKRANTTGEERNSSDVYAGCKHFPTHDRVVLLTVGSSALSLKADIAALMKNLSTLQKDDDGLTDLFSMSFEPAATAPVTPFPIHSSPNPTPVSTPRTTAPKSASATPVTTNPSAPTTPVPSLDLPPTTPLDLLMADTATTIHLFPPTPTDANTAPTVAVSETPLLATSASTLSSTPKANSSLSKATPVSTPTNRRTSSSTASPPKNSVSSTPKATLAPTQSSHTSYATTLAKRNSCGSNLPRNSSTKNPSLAPSSLTLGPPSKLPSYTFGLECLPDVFAQLAIRDFRLMGAPRRITRFVRSTIRQTELEKKGEGVPDHPQPIGDSQPVAVPSTTAAAAPSNPKEENKSVSLDPIHVALQSFLQDITSDSMLCRFSQSLDFTVQDDRLFITLSRSNNKQADARPFVFVNTFIARDLFEKITTVYRAVEQVRVQM